MLNLLHKKNNDLKLRCFTMIKDFLIERLYEIKHQHDRDDST